MWTKTKRKLWWKLKTLEELAWACALLFILFQVVKSKLERERICAEKHKHKIRNQFKLHITPMTRWIVVSQPAGKSWLEIITLFHIHYRHMMTKQALKNSVIFLFHIALIFSIMYIFYLILDKLSFSVLFSVAPQIFHSQPTSPSQWEMLTGCDVSVTRPEVERLRFANTRIYTLIIAPSHPLLSPYLSHNGFIKNILP